jgi:transcriptional regulator with XRE-family HTH domain
MKIESLNTDAVVLGVLGDRLAHTRLERNISQAELAAEAGVSKSTIERLEAGQDVRLASLTRILRALGMLERLDVVLPEPLPSPIERIRLEGRRRRRAAGSRGAPRPEQAGAWSWDIDPDESPK